MMFRTRPNGRGKMVQNNYQSAGYFHARDLGCLRNLDELEEVKVEDCYMTNKTLNKLKQGHIDLLKARKLWDGLCEARNKVINGKGLNKTPKPKRAKRHR